MRIIAGARRGMKLLIPDTRETRPITDRVKESLFMVLQNYDLLAGARAADLFCGVGSLGLEAISRGAASVTFVENNPQIADVLEKNIAKAAFEKQSRVVRASAFQVGAPLGPEGRRYDLVFADPPYAMTQAVGPDSELGKLLHILENQVVPRGVVVVRTQRDRQPLDVYGAFHAVDRRDWGSMSVVLLQAQGDEQQASGD
ncbi:MAG: 16S rRNA (guanine(966)-N(2))-methyltransferase RsmD [Solirubrobacterales bacterium]